MRHRFILHTTATWRLQSEVAKPVRCSHVKPGGTATTRSINHRWERKILDQHLTSVNESNSASTDDNQRTFLTKGKWVYDSNILIPRTQIQSYAIMFVQNPLTQQHKTKTEKVLCHRYILNYNMSAYNIFIWIRCLVRARLWILVFA